MVVDHELDALKREFLEEARMKVAEMATELSRANDPAAAERLAYIAHQLKGSGGSYGYQNISTTAAALEKTLENGAASENHVRKYLTKLEEEIDARTQELSS